ncbi:hypothetical protein WICMUC_002931 [Wickerhamomyces mucosus]|uniref:Uncharacterized protein n=1 Tax=Wickerhamomyces mucosus TaxID=1378264 RepID=A0A9P8PPE1_9ASCO|nr:hypothetical protein WICMUC_002931 [Wickerhamomyces mucosus]
MSTTINPATNPIIQGFKSTTNGAADGTGVLILISRANKLLRGNLPQYLIDYTLSIQNSIFGDYPKKSDIAPSALFMGIFFIFLCAHLFIFFKNWSRGHKFWLSLLFAFYSLLRVLGFLLRIIWADDILKMRIGMTSSVFVIVPIVLLASFNLVLAQRIFTWRHPQLGSTKIFWTGMILIYLFVAGIVVMAIVGALIPYIYFLSQHRYNMCRQVVQAASVLSVLYSLLAMFLVIGAFLIKPIAKDKETWTYQPWWIQSFSPFYYVPKNSCKLAEESFINRDENSIDHVRIIASTTEMPHYNTIEKIHRVSSKSGQLTHNFSILLIFITTFILLLSSIFRCVSTFLEQQANASQSWIYRNWVMYLMFGALEVIVNLLYLIGRVDLRFYRPDKLSKNLLERRKSSVADLEHTSKGSKSDLEKNDVVDSNQDDTVVVNKNPTMTTNTTPNTDYRSSSSV